MKNFKVLLLVLPILFQTVIFSQDLMSARIRKISGKKRAVYFSKGIFHSPSSTIRSELKAIRHGYQARNGYERLVFDFSSKKTPKVYGYKSSKEHKIYIDFFNTTLRKDIGSFGDSKFVSKIEFYPVGDESLSTEIILKGKHAIDVFYLDKPGRLIIDIKN